MHSPGLCSQVSDLFSLPEHQRTSNQQDLERMRDSKQGAHTMIAPSIVPAQPPAQPCAQCWHQGPQDTVRRPAQISAMAGGTQKKRLLGPVQACSGAAELEAGRPAVCFGFLRKGELAGLVVANRRFWDAALTIACHQRSGWVAWA